MSRESAFEIVRSVLCREFEFPSTDVRLSARLVDDLDLDSVDGVALVVRLEEETGIVLRDEEVRSLETVENVVDLVARQLGRS